MAKKPRPIAGFSTLAFLTPTAASPLASSPALLPLPEAEAEAEAPVSTQAQWRYVYAFYAEAGRALDDLHIPPGHNTPRYAVTQAAARADAVGYYLRGGDKESAKREAASFEKWAAQAWREAHDFRLPSLPPRLKIQRLGMRQGVNAFSGVPETTRLWARGGVLGRSGTLSYPSYPGEAVYESAWRRNSREVITLPGEVISAILAACGEDAFQWSSSADGSEFLASCSTNTLQVLQAEMAARRLGGYSPEYSAVEPISPKGRKVWLEAHTF